MTQAEPTRFVGLDVHKHYVMVGAVDARQEVVLPPRRVALVAFPDWARAQLRPSDAVVLEATANAWHLYDLLVPLVAAVTVAHAGAIKLISRAQVKTDRRDTLHLARLLAARMIAYTAAWSRTVSKRAIAYRRYCSGIRSCPPAASSSVSRTAPGGRACPCRELSACASSRIWRWWRR